MSILQYIKYNNKYYLITYCKKCINKKIKRKDIIKIQIKNIVFIQTFNNNNFNDYLKYVKNKIKLCGYKEKIENHSLILLIFFYNILKRSF